MFTKEIIKEKAGKYFKLLGNEWKSVVKVNCSTCGKEIYRKKWLLSKFKHHCSSKCIGNTTKHTVNPKHLKIFELKNTPEFNYLLGLLATDGNITTREGNRGSQKYCCIGLQECDKYLLEQIMTMFGGTICKHWKTSYRWVYYNKHFVEWLISIGITLKKSHTLDVTSTFNTLSPDNKASFMRGVIDGDGCITKYNFTICSASEKFIIMCRNYFECGSIYKNKHNLYILQIGKEAYNKLKEIYINDSFCLKRKYNKFSDIRKRKENV